MGQGLDKCLQHCYDNENCTQLRKKASQVQLNPAPASKNRSSSNRFPNQNTQSGRYTANGFAQTDNHLHPVQPKKVYFVYNPPLKVNKSLLVCSKSKEIDELQRELKIAKQKQIQALERMKALSNDVQNKRRQADESNFTNANEIGRMKEVLDRKEQECSSLKERVISLQNRMKQVEKEMAKLRKKYTHPDCFRFLYEEASQKQFLIAQLEKRLGKRIVKTSHLYSFDPQNKTNFHKYIDDKDNLVVIVRVTNGFIFGGWSAEGLHPKCNSTRDGMIFSLTNRRLYPVISGCQAVTYDNFHIIFGNSEIRLRTNEDKVFSNFGISNGFYENRGDKVEALIGSNRKEIPIEGYDIFQLILRDD